MSAGRIPEGPAGEGGWASWAQHRLRQLASERPEAGLDELEVQHLIDVILQSSRLLEQIYTTERLSAILQTPVPSALPPGLLGLLDRGATPGALARIGRLPDDVRAVGDQCLFDVGISGRARVRGLSLPELGVRAYTLASELLGRLAEDRRLRDYFENNRLRPLPLDEEIAFLRQCAQRFGVHADLLRTLVVEPAEGDVRLIPLFPPGSDVALEGIGLPGTGSVPPAQVEMLVLGAPGSWKDPLRLAPPEELPGRTREEIVAAYERLLLFSTLDVEALRRELLAAVIGQGGAVHALCDEFALYSAATQDPNRPSSYFFVGPTGVGKNHIVESLSRILSRLWGVEVPFLTIEGPNYTDPSDIHDLRGASRGFIRSDEKGLLASFQERANGAPLSIILVDEVEKAHPHLRKFFLSLMDRGFVMDNRGATLRFAGCLIVFTSNLGYGEAGGSGSPIGYRGDEARDRFEESEAEQGLRRALSAEFMNRVKIIRFAHLDPEAIERIFDLEFDRIASRFARVHDLALELTPAARAELIARGYSRAFGARHLAAVLHRTCNVEIARKIRRDEPAHGPAPAELRTWLEEIRAGERAFDEEEVRARVLGEARARTPYRRIRIDFDADSFLFDPVE